MQPAWLVTGAASGIGRELSLKLAARGERLVLWDRDASGLAQTRANCGAQCVHTEALDVVEAEAAQQAALRSVERAGPVLHAIHCAGILRVGPALAMPASDYRAMIEVNYLGTVHVALALVPYLLQTATPHKRARLSLVASVAGLRSIPTLTGYSASKHAVVGFGRGLADELYRDPIDIRVVCPPAVDTPMVRNLAELPAIYRLSPPQSVERVASGILRGIERPSVLTLLDAQSKLLWGLERTFPSGVGWVVKRMSR